ncbi:MAG: polyphenol oxidase family protein [Rhodothermaceae bacterium]|nr:polyphenol oxidase family protein [Rhodothermaceae bacterium]
MIRPALFADLATLTAGFTTRAFAEPTAEAVNGARQRLGNQFGFSDVASAGQVHGSNVAVVRRGGHIPAHDGLVTDQADLLLTVISADCALILLADAEAGILGACHSGWRGTVANVVQQTVDTMTTLGASAARMQAYVSPCIGAEAFEVGEDVAAAFDASVVVRRPEWPRPHVDLKAVLAEQLRAAGVPEARTELDEACTASDTARFYSYRAEGGTPGRLIGFLGRH